MKAGEMHPYGVELRLTVIELQKIAEALKNLPYVEGSETEELVKDFEIMSNLTSIKSLRKFGNFDGSRLNWD